MDAVARTTDAAARITGAAVRTTDATARTANAAVRTTDATARTTNAAVRTTGAAARTTDAAVRTRECPTKCVNEFDQRRERRIKRLKLLLKYMDQVQLKNKYPPKLLNINIS